LPPIFTPGHAIAWRSAANRRGGSQLCRHPFVGQQYLQRDNHAASHGPDDPETVVVQKFLDANTNNVIDAADTLVQ